MEHAPLLNLFHRVDLSPPFVHLQILEHIYLSDQASLHPHAPNLLAVCNTFPLHANQGATIVSDQILSCQHALLQIQIQINSSPHFVNQGVTMYWELILEYFRAQSLPLVK